jgi:hypothetical protein
MTNTRSEMSMPIIVGAIIAVLVLVVLTYIFLSKGATPASQAFSTCDQEDSCVQTASECTSLGKIAVPKSCSTNGKYCCQSLTAQE